MQKDMICYTVHMRMGSDRNGEEKSVCIYYWI